MLIKSQQGSYTVNLDRIEAILTRRTESGEVAIYARTPGGNCYKLGEVEEERQAQRIVIDIAESLRAGAPLYVIPKLPKKKHRGGGLDWDGPPEAHTYHLKEQAEGQTAAINFHPDIQPTLTPADLTPAEQRAAAEAGKPSEERLQWADTIADDISDAEAAEIKAYNAQTTAENLDIICCSYPEDARGAIITQTGEIIGEPGDWQTMSAVPTPDGNLAITLEERGLDALGDPKCEIIGVYSEERALRVYRDLRAQIEDADTPVKITMPD